MGIRLWSEYDVNYNMIYMTFAHFKKERISKVLDMVKGYSTFSKVLTEVVFSDVWEQRSNLISVRKYDDDWFFKKFGINF
mgnify:CR=1 FL=1